MVEGLMSGIPIRGKARGTWQEAFATAVKRGAKNSQFNRDFFRYLWEDADEAGTNAEVHAAQWDLETGGGTSYEWDENGNPGGVGVFPDGSTAGYRFTAKQAARQLVTHMLVYAGLPLPSGWVKSYRWDVVVNNGWYGTVTTTADLGNGKWATDPRYAQKLVERYEAYWGPYVSGGLELPEEPTVTTFKKHAFPGLPKPVYLPSWIAVEIKIIPSSVPGWTSGQKLPVSNFTSTTYHDTGNPSSSATSEYNWAAEGGRAEINSPGSYNGIFDKGKIIISQRFDEMVGHAGVPIGNNTSYAFEEAYGAGGHDGALEVGMWLHAGVLQAMGLTAAESMYQHNHWTGKSCPGQIRARNQWSYVEDTVDARIDEINAYLKSGTETPTTPPPGPKPFAKPSDISFQKDLGTKPYYKDGNTRWFNGTGRYTANKDTKQLQYAVTTSDPIADIIKKGSTVVEVAHGTSKTDGKQYVLLANKARVLMDDLTPIKE